MRVEETYDLWLEVDEAAEIIRGYEFDCRIKPNDTEMHFDYGLAFMGLGIGLESYAIAAFKEAIRLRPFWAEAYSQLGLAYASANRRKEAVESYRQALKFQPNDIGTLAALTHAYLFLGRYSEAEQVAVKMIEVVPLASGHYLALGFAQLLQSHYTEASESLKRALSLEPDLSEACYGIGLAAIAQGNDGVAQCQHDSLMKLDRNLARELFRQRQSGGFTPAEIIDCLFNPSCDLAARGSSRNVI